MMGTNRDPGAFQRAAQRCNGGRQPLPNITPEHPAERRKPSRSGRPTAVTPSQAAASAAKRVVPQRKILCLFRGSRPLRQGALGASCIPFTELVEPRSEVSRFRRAEAQRSPRNTLLYASGNARQHFFSHFFKNFSKYAKS